jgi:ribonuclease BN (tRNA processing enzyme)
MYATDTEHYSVVDPKLARLAKGVDVLIYDTMYLPEEYTGAVGGLARTGWGHSTYEQGIELARVSHAKRLVLFHHDPLHNDEMVMEKERRAKALFAESVAAYEGLEIEL